MSAVVWRGDADDGETACHFSLAIGGGDMSRIAVCQNVEGISSCSGAATMSECTASGRGESHAGRWLVMRSRIRVLSSKRRM